MGKPWVRLYPIDIERMDWRPLPDVAGAAVKVLAEDAESGSLTRYLRADAGTTVPSARDRWEETFVLEGTYTFDGRGYGPGSYLCLPPGTEPAQASTDDGVVCFQVVDHDADLAKPEVRLTADEIAAMDWMTASRGDPKHREKILARDDRGSLTRLLEIDPGGDTTELDDHDHNEEVLILRGACKNGDEFHPAGTYTFNPPHAQHGPFLVDELLVCFEVKNQP